MYFWGDLRRQCHHEPKSFKRHTGGLDLVGLHWVDDVLAHCWDLRGLFCQERSWNSILQTNASCIVPGRNSKHLHWFCWQLLLDELVTLFCSLAARATFHPMVAPDLVRTHVVALCHHVGHIVAGHVPQRFVEPLERGLVRDRPVDSSAHTNEVCPLELSLRDVISHSIVITSSWQVDKDQVWGENGPGTTHFCFAHQWIVLPFFGQGSIMGQPHLEEATEVSLVLGAVLPFSAQLLRRLVESLQSGKCLSVQNLSARLTKHQTQWVSLRNL